MANTTNLNMVKPAGTDHALISVINSNMDIIDGAVGALPSGSTLQGEIESANTAIGTLGSFESLGTASSLANLESALLTKAQAMSMNEVRPVKIATTFTTDGFVSNASYGGFLKVLYKTGSNLYFTITFDGIISSSVKPIYMMYNDGTWTVSQLALKSDVKKKTYTNITTSASGNASFEDLLTTNTIVLAVICTTDAASVCIPYRNNATYNRWGVHVITDNATNTVKTSTTLSFEVYYIDV